MAGPGFRGHCQTEIQFGEKVRSWRRGARQCPEVQTGNNALGILAGVQPVDQQFPE